MDNVLLYTRPKNAVPHRQKRFLKPQNGRDAFLLLLQRYQRYKIKKGQKIQKTATLGIVHQIRARQGIYRQIRACQSIDRQIWAHQRKIRLECNQRKTIALIDLKLRFEIRV